MGWEILDFIGSCHHSQVLKNIGIRYNAGKMSRGNKYKI